jgi:hypothetical protein
MQFLYFSIIFPLSSYIPFKMFLNALNPRYSFLWKLFFRQFSVCSVSSTFSEWAETYKVRCWIRMSSHHFKRNSFSWYHKFFHAVGSGNLFLCYGRGKTIVSSSITNKLHFWDWPLPWWKQIKIKSWLIHVSWWCLLYLTFRLWKWRQNIPPKYLVDFQRTTRRYIPEDRTLHNHRCCENLKSYIHHYKACIYSLLAHHETELINNHNLG